MSDKCMTPNCSRFASLIERRGLCLVCFSRAKKLVESGATSWNKLAEMDLVRKSPTESTVEERQDPFTEAFNKAKDAEQDAGTDTGADH